MSLIENPNPMNPVVDGEKKLLSALWSRWLSRVADVLNRLHPAPLRSIVLTDLAPADIADTTKFDATGLGVGGYAGWALCNGNNGTIDLLGFFGGPPYCLTKIS